MEDMRTAITKIASSRDIHLDSDWSTFDAIEPLLKSIMGDGAVIVVKMDGARAENKYDVFVEGGLLGRRTVRVTHDVLLQAILLAVLKYSSPTSDVGATA